MYSNSSRTPCVPWIVSTHITGHVWTTCILCDRQVATSHMLTATEKQHGPIPSCGLKMLVVQNCNMGCNMGFTWNSQKSQPMHTPTLPCSRVEMPSNGRCLAWWQEECKVFGLGGQGRQKGKKKGKKNLSPQVFVRVFSHCHQDSPPQGGCRGVSVRKWLMPAKLPRRSYFKNENNKQIKAALALRQHSYFNVFHVCNESFINIRYKWRE